MTNALRLQLASIIIIVFIALDYLSAKRRKTKTHISFTALLGATLLNIVVDYVLVLYYVVQGQWSDVLTRLYLITLCLVLVLVRDYISFSIHEIEGKTYISTAVWGCIFIGVTIFACVGDIEYYLRNGWYFSDGGVILVIHTFLGVFLFDSLVLLVLYWKKLPVRKAMAMLLALSIQAIVFIIQLFDTNNIITSLGNVLMIISLYVISENPDQLLIEQLQYEKERATMANASKSSFIAHISHEIRTPINAILGMDEMIIRESKEEKSRQYASDISQAANTLYGIINDVLDMSRMESGKMDIFPVEYSLNQLVYDVVAMQKPRIEAKQLDFFVDINPSLPSEYYGDDVHLKQIISNLLSNAVKYTHEGFIKITVDGEYRGDFVDLFFEIKDTGIGIKEEDISKLFIAFERIEESRNRNIEGTGLGMTITNTLLRLMGSHLNVSSVYGEGSIFSFVITQRIVKAEAIGDYYKYSKAQEEPSEVMFTAPGVKILVVDDNALNRRVFTSLLSRTEIVIDEADSGPQCLEMIRKEQYDIIFLDQMMPDMDGIDTIKAIKNDDGHVNSNTPIILLTANSTREAKEVYRQAGFDSYLTKPIFSNQLEKIIRTYVSSFKILNSKKAAPIKVSSKPDNWKNDLPKIRGIDWTDALKHLPTQDVLFSTLREFRKGIESESAVLDEYFEHLEVEENLELFRIKCHSIKSSAGAIGAEMLYEGAKELEEAAKEGNLAIIREKYPYMINYYRSFSERLAEFDDGDITKNSNIDFPQVLALIEMVRLEMYDLNKDNALEALDEIETYLYPKDIQTKITNLREAVIGLDSEKVSDLVDILLTEVRILRNS